MSSNTTKRHRERRVSKRVPVLFSAILIRKGFRSQIVEVLDLSDTGAKVQMRFPMPAGSPVTLKMAGPRGKLEVPGTIANLAEEDGYPVSGLRFEVPDSIRRDLKEIVERVDTARQRAALEEPILAGPVEKVMKVKGNTKILKRVTQITRRTTRSTRKVKGLPPPGANTPGAG